MILRHDGVAIAYDVAGAGDPLTLLHGVGSNLGSWDAIVPALTDRFRVLRYDLRGHGASGKPAGPYALADFVEDLRALLDAEGVSRTMVAGFSFGGMIAPAFAVAYPERVSRLCIISAVAGRTPAQRAAAITRAEKLAAGGPARHVDAAIERWFTPEFRAGHHDVIERQVARVLGNDPVGYAAAYRVFAESDLIDQLGRISCPTLIVTGEHDQGSTPAMARTMHERIAGSRLVILPRYRHSLLVEAAADITGLLREFLGAAGNA